MTSKKSFGKRLPTAPCIFCITKASSTRMKRKMPLIQCPTVCCPAAGVVYGAMDGTSHEGAGRIQVGTRLHLLSLWQIPLRTPKPTPLASSSLFAHTVGSVVVL